MRSWLRAVSFGIAILCGPSGIAFQLPDGGEAGVAIVPRARPHPAASSEQHPTLRIDSALVQVPVHVTNALGASVTGLDREAFRLLEDRTEQIIRSFCVEDAPVSVGFLFDASGSMRSKMRKSAEAAASFFRTSNNGDEFFLVEFNDRAKLTVPFTRNPEEINQQIARTRPAGRTTLIDAIHVALAEMKHARHSRKAIVILSDGGDNWSRHSAREIRSALLESDVQLYAMGIFDADANRHTAEERNGPRLLDDLAERTGGKLYPVEDLEKLPAISERIGRELRSVYLLGYYSTNEGRDGKYRQVTVKLAGPEARDLRIDYRRGYYAPAD